MSWVLVSDLRSVCLKLNIWGMVFVFSLILIQTVTGKIAGSVFFVWIWVLIVTLPLFILLWISLIKNSRPSKIIPSRVHRMVIISSVLYQSFVILTLLIEPFATLGKISTAYFFINSLFWLLPFETLMLVGYVLLLFKKEEIFKPDSKAILDIVKNKAAQAIESDHKKQYSIYELIACDKISEALDVLENHAHKEDGNMLNSIILLRNQYSRIIQGKKLNLNEPEHEGILYNRLLVGILDVVETIAK